MKPAGVFGRDEEVDPGEGLGLFFLFVAVEDVVAQHGAFEQGREQAGGVEAQVGGMRDGHPQARHPHLGAALEALAGHLAQPLRVELFRFPQPPEDGPFDGKAGRVVEDDLLVLFALELFEAERALGEGQDGRIGVNGCVFANGDQQGVDFFTLQIDSGKMDHGHFSCWGRRFRASNFEFGSGVPGWECQSSSSVAKYTMEVFFNSSRLNSSE